MQSKRLLTALFAGWTFCLPAEAIILDDEPPQPAVKPKSAATPKPHKKNQLRTIAIEMIELPTGILMGKYEITQGQWRKVMGNNPAYFNDCGDNCPIEQVSWDDVQVFIGRLISQTGKVYRLPTEEEWYAACQADYATEYCGSNNIDAVAWYDNNSGNRTHPVGQKSPNAWGLYDMSGNVWEWMQNYHRENSIERVNCGGSWNRSSHSVRAAYPSWDEPSLRSGSVGFRLVQDR